MRRNYLYAKVYLLPLCNNIFLPNNLLLNIIIINYYLFLHSSKQKFTSEFLIKLQLVI